jgi:hypothetical protein
MHDLYHTYTAYSKRPENLKIKYDSKLMSAIKVLASLLYRHRKEKSNVKNS